MILLVNCSSWFNSCQCAIVLNIVFISCLNTDLETKQQFPCEFDQLIFKIKCAYVHKLLIRTAISNYKSNLFHSIFLSKAMFIYTIWWETDRIFLATSMRRPVQCFNWIAYVWLIKWDRIQLSWFQAICLVERWIYWPIVLLLFSFYYITRSSKAGRDNFILE